MATNPRFQVRETEDGLRALDKAIKTLGYSSRAHWYNETKRQTILKSREEMKMTKFEISLKEDSTFGLSGQVEWYGEEHEVTWNHVTTNQQCQSLDQCFAGWSENTKEDNNSWDELRRRISECDGDYFIDWMVDEKSIKLSIDEDSIMKRI